MLVRHTHRTPSERLGLVVLAVEWSILTSIGIGRKSKIAHPAEAVGKPCLYGFFGVLLVNPNLSTHKLAMFLTFFAS